MNNNKKLIYLFFDQTIRIAKNGETKTFPKGRYIATEDECNKFDLNKYREIALSFIGDTTISDDDGNKQVFKRNEEYPMPKYKFDKLKFSRAQWGELTLDCVLKNVLELPFEAFNRLDNNALDRVFYEYEKEQYEKAYKKEEMSNPENQEISDEDSRNLKQGKKCVEIKKACIEQSKKYEEEIYTHIISQRPELVVFFNIRFLYEKLILDKSQNVFKISFKKYIGDIKNFNSSYLYDHAFYKFFCNIGTFDDSNEITGLKKKPNEILLDFIGFFFEDNPKNSNLALICLCINEMDSDYLTSRFFSGEQNAIQEIYDALFEDGELTNLSKRNFPDEDKVEYENTEMPLYSAFFACLISKLKYKTEYKDKFLELISFGGYKNYDGEYEIPAWNDKLELLRFVDPNFIRDNLDNNLVQKYLKKAKGSKKHEDYLKKIAEYSENFHGNLKPKEDYLLKLVEIGLIEYVDTKFICENIDNEIIQNSLSHIKDINKQDDLFHYFYGLYKDKKEPEEIKAIDKHIYMLMNYYEYIIWHLDDELIINNLNKSYIRDNIYRVDDKDRQQEICNKLDNQYQDAIYSPNEQKQKIIENVLFLIQAKYCGDYINYFDNDFIVELLFSEGGDTVAKYFEDIKEKKARELCSKLCEKYEESANDEKTKCERYILQLIKNDNDNRHVANYLSGKFVLDHIGNDIIKQKTPRLILKTCQELCNKYSESQEKEKENYKNIIIDLVNERCLDAQYLSPEFIVECVFEDDWLRKIDRTLNKYESPELKKLVEYLCDKYQNGKNDTDKTDYTNKIFQLIKVNSKAVRCLSVKFIAENFDIDAIKDNLKQINDPEKQKELYDYFCGEYNKAKNDKNEKLENINKSRIIKLINERKDVILNADVDIEFIFENWNDVVNSLQNLKSKYVNDKIRQHLKGKYLFNGNNEPDFGKQEKNKNKVLEWTKKINKLINLLHPKFIAENLSHEVILSKLHYLNNENVNLLYDYICNNYGDEEKKGKILVLIKKLVLDDYFISRRFLYDNFNEEIVQTYIFQHIGHKKLWQTLYECYLSDKDKETGKQKFLNFIEACNGKISFWHWYDEINIPFVCDCLGEEIIQKLIDNLRVFVNKERDYAKTNAKTKMKEMFKYLCKAQKEYESKKVGKDRTADILKLIDIFRYGYGIQYVNAEFIYKNFYTEEVLSNLDHITISQGKELVNCIKNHPKEDEVEQYFLKLISVSDGFANYMDMEWIYQHLGNETIQKRLYLITQKKHIQELYDCIVTSEKNIEQKKKDILMIAGSHKGKKALIDFLCVIDAKFVLDNLDDSQDTRIKEMVKLCLSSYYDFGCESDLDLARKFALRKLICAIELVQDKSEQDKLYLKLLNTLDNSANVFRYTSVKFLEDRVDSENKDIKKYIAENISVRPYQYEYGKNAETIKKSENINKDDKFIMCLFDDISENNKKDDNKFLEEALKYIKAYEIHDLSSLVRICGDMSAYLEIWDAFTKFIDECKTYDSSFFGKLLDKTDPDENLALKLIDSEYFSDKNKDDKESCLNFFGRVLKSVDKYDDDYYKNFVCKLIEIDSKFVTENINKKFLAANCEKPELKKLINPKEENYALTEDDAKEMFKYLDPKNERDKKIILEQINLDAIFCRWVSDEFLIENWNNENIQREITRRITKPVSIKGENGLFNFLDVIEKRTDLDTEGKKQASLKLLSFDTSGYKLIDDKRNLDFVIDNIKCAEIQKQLKTYLQRNGGHTRYEKDILPKIKTKTEKDGWDEKRREDTILILISCNYCAAVNFIDIKFLMSHDEGRAAIKDQVFNSQFYNSEDNIFNRVLKYLKRKTEKDGWSDGQKEDFISGLILNGGEKSYRIESIAFNLKNPLVQDFMKEHLKADDEIFKSLIDYLNHGYTSPGKYFDQYANEREKKYFESRILYLISLQPEFVIDYVNPNFLFNNRQKDLVKSRLKKYSYTEKNYYDFIFSLISCNPNLIKKPFYVKSIIDGMRYEYCLIIKRYLRNYFDSADNFGHSLFVELENQLYSSWDENFAKNRLLELISLNPKRVIEWMISDKDNHYDENAKFLVDCLDNSDEDNESKSDILNGLVMLLYENENHNGIRRIFDKLTNKILKFLSWNFKNLLDDLKDVLCDKNNSAFLEKYLVYINQLGDIDKKNKILKLLKEWNINTEIQTESVDKNNLREKDSKNNTDVELISSNINKGNDNDTKEKIQESMVNINSIPNINPKIDLNKNQNKNKNNKTEEEIMYEGIVRDQKNFPKQNIPNKITEEKIIVSDNNNSINQEKQNRPASNLFKAKILHNPLMIAIGFIILSVLFGVIGFAVGTKWLCIISAVILFVDLVFLLAWSIKKCRKKSHDIREINVSPDDYQEETKTKENIKSEDRSNESEIDTKSPTLISQEFGKE